MCVETPCDVAALSDDALAGVIDAFEADRRRASAGEMDVLAVRLGRLGVSARPGDLAGELVERQGVSRRDARRREDVAAQWPAMLRTARALRDGEISFDHVVTMARAAREHPDAFPADEAELLAQAARRAAGAFAIVVNRWVKANDGDDGDDRSRRARNRARVDRFDAGADMFGIICELANLDGQQIWAAIETEARRLWRNDHPLFDDTSFDPGRDTPSAGRYRCAALHSLICGRGVGGRNVTTQVIVTTTVTDVDNRRGGELLDGTQISGAELARLICDSPLAGLIFGARGEVLWHGTNVRLATPAQRRAVKTRDRHCTVGACETPADRCEIHHLHPFADGGPTNIDNLALTCPRCHHKIHDHNWTHTGTPGVDLTWHPPAPPAHTSHPHNKAPPRAA